MSSRAFFSVTRFFMIKCFRSVNVVTSHRFSDVVPVITAGRQMKKRERAVKAGGAAAEADAACPVCRDKSGAVTITVHAKPGSKLSAITDVGSEAVGVSIAAPPTDGEANAELVRYLAEVLQLKKSHVCLNKGSRSRDKLIRLDSSLSPEEVLRRLREEAG